MIGYKVENDSSEHCQVIWLHTLFWRNVFMRHPQIFQRFPKLQKTEFQ